MTKTQIYLPEEELAALHEAAKRADKTVAQLVREAVRAVWLRPAEGGPVAIWNGQPKRVSIDHDSI
ncbi:MAG TPA: CopG family transcriptional regulator [Polyangiaceae bacterium]|nr:CopG family transcriptional regulator [Polyangiaceae bacterium]